MFLLDTNCYIVLIHMLGCWLKKPKWSYCDYVDIFTDCDNSVKLVGMTTFSSCSLSMKKKEKDTAGMHNKFGFPRTVVTSGLPWFQVANWLWLWLFIWMKKNPPISKAHDECMTSWVSHRWGTLGLFYRPWGCGQTRVSLGALRDPLMLWIL